MRALVVLVLLVSSSVADAKRIACSESLGPVVGVAGDAIPPAAPIVRWATFESGTLWIDATFGDDTHRVRITFEAANGETIELWTLPQPRLSVCAHDAPALTMLPRIARSSRWPRSMRTATSLRPLRPHRSGTSDTTAAAPGSWLRSS